MKAELIGGLGNVVARRLGRVVDMMSWPASGDATRVWGQNPSAWGEDNNLVSWVFQPLLFAGQYQDVETLTQDDYTIWDKPPIVLNGFRTYDPFTGGYLQMDPWADQTWSPYVYADSDPVGGTDPSGLMVNNHAFERSIEAIWRDLANAPSASSGPNAGPSGLPCGVTMGIGVGVGGAFGTAFGYVVGNAPGAVAYGAEGGALGLLWGAMACHAGGPT